ncbi:MAG: hypothetical protein KAS70_02080, partial [Planctomycetes bacterium]|nr:hypothetical protein [Planctomycetota bacterium]
TFGEYKNKARAMYRGGFVISNEAIRKVKVLPDPIFDYSTIIGKVFNDRNRNGRQDKGEMGIKGVKIATEDGIVVTTDRDGKYHIAGLKPQTKLIKLNENSLPLGGELTTMNPVVARFTLGGTLAKVNFGVLLSGGLAEMSVIGEVVIPITITTEPKFKLKLGGEVIPLKWTQPLEKQPEDAYTALRMKIEKIRVKGEALITKSNELMARSERLKSVAEKKETESEELSKRYLTRSEEFKKQSDTLRQQAEPFIKQAEIEEEKLVKSVKKLEEKIISLKKQYQELTTEIRQLKTKSEEYKNDAESLRSIDRKLSGELLEDSKKLKEQSETRQTETKKIKFEIARFTKELERKKGIKKGIRRKQELQVKINGQLIKVDPVKGYRDDFTLKPDTRKINIWMRDIRGRETRFVKAVSIPKLKVSVYRSEEEA